ERFGDHLVARPDRDYAALQQLVCSITQAAVMLSSQPAPCVVVAVCGQPDIEGLAPVSEVTQVHESQSGAVFLYSIRLLLSLSSLGRSVVVVASVGQTKRPVP